MFPTLLVFVVLIFVVNQFMRLPKFGRIPEGERLQRILNSPNFRDRVFQNQNPTPQLAEGAGFSKMIGDRLSAKNTRPKNKIPSQKTNLFSLNNDEDVLVWFGHSSYYFQTGGRKFLVDPVLSGHASPFSFMVKSFDGADIYSYNDIPEIDYLIITHDHWDHLDYKTIKALKLRIKKVVCPLGVGEHFERWGFEKNRIIEKDWDEKADLEQGFVVHFTPARHFAGRGFKAKRTLWASFVLESPQLRIFIGGDGGYDTHFAKIGEQFGPFDLAVLENGQYNTSWKYIHMLPEQTLQAAKDLQAKRLFPAHNSKFALAIHSWDEPLKRITELNQKEHIALVTPMIGQKVNLADFNQKFSKWWEGVE